MIKIGHARISEKGTIDGVKGDQTKKEVCITDWYFDCWLAVYRPKNPIHAEKIARTCELACNNDYIGYSQYSRYSLFNLVCNNGYDIANLKTPCNCDCSSLVMVCCRSANINVPKAMFTYSEDRDLMKTANFDKLTASKYTANFKYLKRGDILLKRGHTAIVLSDGSSAENGKRTQKAISPAQSFNRVLAGTKTLIVNANMRNGGGLSHSVMTVVPMGAKVKTYGYYTKDARGVKWLYCVYDTSKCEYIGFISERLLK